MLILEVSPKKPKPEPPAPTPKPPWPYPATTTNVTRLSMAIARDNIIKKAAKECPFVKGQVVVPSNPDEAIKHGECYIQGIAQNYAQYGGETHWPENNSPLIITAVDQHGQTMFTNSAYFKAK